MIRFFGISIETLTGILLVIAGLIVLCVLLLAWRNRIFFTIGVRNITRRRLQLILIVFALMLSTTLLSSVLATGDVLTATVQSVAVYNWGNVDELIEGGHGPLGTFSDDVYDDLQERRAFMPDIAAVGAALRETDLLLADQSSRQVRSKVTALAVLPGSEQGFGGLHDSNSNRRLSIAALAANQVYLNQTTAQLLNARRGDTLYLYSERWPGRRYSMQVAAIVENGGLVGDSPALLSQLRTFQDIEGNWGQINQIYVANRGGTNGVNLTDQATDELHYRLSRNVHIIAVKQQGVQASQRADEIFSRIFSLFALFALAIGLLLIVLIFVLLAAERRAEMGMARAVGVQRRHLVFMFLFEGSVYDFFSSLIGALIGLGVGVLVIALLGPLLARFNFPLKFTLQPNSLVVAYCLGVIFTFCSVVLSSWLVSRMTIVEAIRDQPEPSRFPFTLGELSAQVVVLLRQLFARSVASERRARRILFAQFPDLLLAILQKLTLLGPLPILVGLLLMQLGLRQMQVIPFSLGLSLLTVGAVFLLKAIIVWGYGRMIRRRNPAASITFGWRNTLDGIFAALTGISLLAYWALPFDVLAFLGLPRFQGGIEVFFVAGVMMVLGAVWVLVANARALSVPWLVLSARLARLHALIKLAAAYPLQRRFRTGLSIIMFSLVVFAMTVMAVITNAMQNTYVDINAQTGGYDIQATAYFKALPDLSASLVQHGINPASFTAIGVRTTTEVGVIQPGAENARWSLYPAQVVSGGFLQGYGLHLVGRANGLGDDGAVWKALQEHPDDALIDSSALPIRPNATNQSVYDPSVPGADDAGEPKTPPGLDPNYTFAMNGVYQGDETFAATSVWVTGVQGSQSRKFTIIGIVDNSDSAHFGLYLSDSAYSKTALEGDASGAETALQQGLYGQSAQNTSSGADLLQARSYYFKAAPGQDKRALALALGSAYLDNGLETTVLEDAIWQVRGPRILLSNVLLGVVGMTLLLGVAALAIMGTRAVIERRQQIGMLRAIGCSRRTVQGAFLLESFLIGAIGSILGVVLGLILARNIFAANFFEQYQTGLAFSIPWQELELIIAVAFGASLLGAILPAWQAGRIAPAEALRYA